MMKYYAIIFLALFSLWGCAPNSQPINTLSKEISEPTGTPPLLPTVAETPLAKDGLNESVGEMSSTKPNPAGSKQGSEQTLADQEVTAVAPAGVIDLSEINQEQMTTDDGELVELPAPGIPNPQMQLIELATKELATRLDINANDILVVDVELKGWPDSSLGCPANDTDYLTVILSGFRITLEANGDSYIYHTDMGERVILCENGRPAES